MLLETDTARALEALVCNLDGRVLLYNNRARLQFKALSSAPQVAEGADLIGLGRSIYAVFDRALVSHALERIQQRLERGAAAPSAQFVTVTARGQLLRAQMAPVRDVGAAPGAAGADGASPLPALSGFVLLLENITRDCERDTAQDGALQAYTEASRASLANLQAALELLDTPDLDPAMHQRFLAVVREEAVASRSARWWCTEPYNDPRRASPHGSAANRVRWGTKQP